MTWQRDHYMLQQVITDGFHTPENSMFQATDAGRTSHTLGILGSPKGKNIPPKDWAS
jgi:hypothetical protein